MRSLIISLLLLPVFVALAAEQMLPGINPIEVGRREFQEGKLDAALATIAEAEKNGVRNARSLELRGCILMEQGKFDEALQSFTAAREIDPATYGRLHIGDALRRQGKWEEAREAYRTGLKDTNILNTNERLRFAVFITYLGARDEEHAREALAQLTFPTESPAYYYAQAAWAFAHGANRDGETWVKRADEIFTPKVAPRATAWFARHLYDFGWLKSKPPLVVD